MTPASRSRLNEELLDKAAIACEALDAYHAVLERAAAEVGTGIRLSRPLVPVGRRRTCLALTRLALALPREGYDGIREIAEGVTGGYSLPEWTLRVRKIVASAAKPLPAAVGA